MIKVLVTCSDGFSLTDICDEPFSIITGFTTSDIETTDINPTPGLSSIQIVVGILLLVFIRRNIYVRKDRNKR